MRIVLPGFGRYGIPRLSTGHSPLATRLDVHGHLPPVRSGAEVCGIPHLPKPGRYGAPVICYGPGREKFRLARQTFIRPKTCAREPRSFNPEVPFPVGDTLERMILRTRAAAVYGVVVLLLSSISTAVAQDTQEETLQQYSQAGQQALAAGRYDEAESDFKKLVPIDPNIAEIHATLGLVTFRRKSSTRLCPNCELRSSSSQPWEEQARCWRCHCRK